MNLNKQNLEKIKFSVLQNFNYCWIAGGAVADFYLDKKPNDIDIYFPNEKARKGAVNKFVNLGAKKKYEYALGTKLFYKGMRYDFMFSESTPEKCIEQFDYTVCAAAIDKEENFFSHPDFLEHLHEKKLYFIQDPSTGVSTHPMGRARRLQKYLKKGFVIDEDQLKYWLNRLIKDNEKPRRRV